MSSIVMAWRLKLVSSTPCRKVACRDALMGSSPQVSWARQHDGATVACLNACPKRMSRRIVEPCGLSSVDRAQVSCSATDGTPWQLTGQVFSMPCSLSGIVCRCPHPNNHSNHPRVHMAITCPGSACSPLTGMCLAGIWTTSRRAARITACRFALLKRI